MAKLTKKQRDRLPRSDFAIPEMRLYPIENPAHGRNALSRVSAFGSASQKKEVRAAVAKKYPSIGCSSCGRDTHTHYHGKNRCCGNPICCVRNSEHDTYSKARGGRDLTDFQIPMIQNVGFDSSGLLEL